MFRNFILIQILMSNYSASEEQKFGIYVVDATMNWDLLSNLLISEELLHAGSVVGRWLSAIALLRGYLSSRRLPHWRIYLLPMTD